MIEKLRRPLLLKVFLLRKLPLAYLARLKVVLLTDSECLTSMKYGWITTNPFRSMYFAAQSMAAEFSTAVLAVQAIEKSGKNVAMIITKLEAEFLKKAIGNIEFKCEDGEKFSIELSRALEKGESVEIQGTSIGRDEAGEVVSEFKITWSFKERLNR